jgi:hypothetical protein
MSGRRRRNCETHRTRLPGECSDPRCPHDWDDCGWPGGADACPHWHCELDVTVTAEMVQSAEILGASGGELLAHAVNSALRGGQS